MLFKTANQSPKKTHFSFSSAEPGDYFKNSGFGLLESVELGVKPSLLTRLITYLCGSNKVIKEAAG